MISGGGGGIEVITRHPLKCSLLQVRSEPSKDSIFLDQFCMK